MVTVFTCSPCETAAIQTQKTGLEWTCWVHGLDRQTADVPFRGYVADCPTCEKAAATGTLPFVRHDNCTSPGRPGHSRDGHCTSDYCY